VHRTDHEPERLLAAWFEGPLDDPAYARERVMKVWFKTDFGFDAHLRERFADTLDAAAAGTLEHWLAAPRSALAYVVLCDQIPRNIHRGTPRAFATDARARTAAGAILERGWDGGLRLMERLFLYQPFEHAEDLMGQDFCVAGFRRLHDEAPAAFKTLMWDCVQSGETHREVIRRFGRFPHRNPILGRASTAEELAWMDGHHGWGQGPASLAKRPDAATDDKN